ncbi:MAG TPA: hypothetical protein VEB40_07485 [Flavipsychrobacter sp.]|nr:hypothetical protein [Flavipsychrobacter sp.]
MAKPKKRINKNSGGEAQPFANAAMTNILPDNDETVFGPSRRRSAGQVKTGEIVTVRNKQNGAMNKMSAVYAIKLVAKSAEIYEILK